MPGFPGREQRRSCRRDDTREAEQRILPKEKPVSSCSASGGMHGLPPPSQARSCSGYWASEPLNSPKGGQGCEEAQAPRERPEDRGGERQEPQGFAKAGRPFGVGWIGFYFKAGRRENAYRLKTVEQRREY